MEDTKAEVTFLHLSYLTVLEVERHDAVHRSVAVGILLYLHRLDGSSTCRLPLYTWAYLNDIVRQLRNGQRLRQVKVPQPCVSLSVNHASLTSDACDEVVAELGTIREGGNSP